MKYSFECKRCGTEFTVTMSVKKYESLKVKGCPVCFSERIVRDYEDLLGIHFKGNDFTKSTKEEKE